VQSPVLAEEQMEIFQASLSGIPLLRVVGDVDHHTSDALNAAVHEVLAEDHNRLLLDLSAVPYVDSGGVAVIFTALKAVQGRGWVGVVGPNPNVRRILELVGLLGDQSFIVVGSEDEAAKLISGGAEESSSQSLT